MPSRSITPCSFFDEPPWARRIIPFLPCFTLPTEMRAQPFLFFGGRMFLSRIDKETSGALTSSSVLLQDRATRRNQTEPELRW